MIRDQRYIYGFISSNKPEKFGPIGIDRREVYTLSYQDIAAVVSDLPSIQFDSLPKETLLRHLAVYQSVIEAVMQNHQIIPMKFGTIVQGGEEVKRILGNGYGQINVNLREMENKIELDVAALWSDFESVLKEIGEEEAIKKLKKEAASKPADQIFEIKINMGKLVKATLDKKRENCASEILDALKKEAEDHRPHDVMDDSMIMNIAFLINKDKKNSFESKVDDLDKHFKSRIDFRIVGPLPPYSFSTFEMKKVKFSQVNEAREMLGLGEESTSMEIRETYRELSKKLHPDKYPGDREAQKRFEKMTKAYQMIIDYCQQDRCSFKETDVREWIAVRQLERPRTFA